MISIWFFVGCLLTIYGILILAAGIRQISGNDGAQFAMKELHLQVWWGTGLVLMGLGYTLRFWPRRRPGRDPRQSIANVHDR